MKVNRLTQQGSEQDEDENDHLQRNNGILVFVLLDMVTNRQTKSIGKQECLTKHLEKKLLVA